MSIDSTGLTDKFLLGPVENKEDIAVSSTDVVQTLSTTDTTTYQNSIISTCNTTNTSTILTATNPAVPNSNSGVATITCDATNAVMGVGCSIDGFPGSISGTATLQATSSNPTISLTQSAPFATSYSTIIDKDGINQNNIGGNGFTLNSNASPLALTTTDNLTFSADNIDLSTTGHLILPSSSSGNFLDYNTGSLKIVNDSVAGLNNPLLVLQNNNTTAGAVVVETYKNEPAGISTAGDTIASYSAYCNANNNVGVATKTEMAKINFVAQGVGTNNNDGTIGLACKVNSAMNNFVVCNGGVLPSGEVQVFKPLDTNGNAIKTSSGNISLDSTASVGTGLMTLATKNELQLICAPGFGIRTDEKISTLSNISGSYVDFVGGTPLNKFELKPLQLQLYNQITVPGPSGYTQQTQILATQDALSDSCQLTFLNGKSTGGGSVFGGIFNSQVSQYIELGDTRTGNLGSIKIDNNTSAVQNRMDLTKDTGVGQVATSSLVNDTSTQNLQFNYQDGLSGRSLNLSNDSASGGVLNYTNQISGGQPFTIDSSTGELILKTTATHALTLDSDILNLKNTNTTTSVANHNADIKATSTGLESTAFLKLQLNGADIWVPYFTTDPSL